MLGIARHLDRETGRLGGHFTPRYAAPTPVSGLVQEDPDQLAVRNPTPVSYGAGDLRGARCWVATGRRKRGPAQDASWLEVAHVLRVTPNGNLRVEVEADGRRLLFATDGRLRGQGGGRAVRNCRVLAATPALDRAREAQDARDRVRASLDRAGDLLDEDALAIDRAVSAALARAAEVRP